VFGLSAREISLQKKILALFALVLHNFFNKVTGSAVLATTSFCSGFVAILLTSEKLGGNFQSNNTVSCTKLHVLVQNL